MTQQFNPNMEEIFRSRKKQEVFERKFHTVTVWISYWYVWEGKVIHKSGSTLIVPIAPRGHASRDAPRHKWHRLRIQ